MDKNKIILFICTALFFHWNAIPIIPCVFFCQHSSVERGQPGVWKAIRLCTCVCEVRTGLWWSANILCDVLWCVCWQTWRFCTIRCADVSISPLCLYRSHINSINMFLSFSPIWLFFFRNSHLTFLNTLSLYVFPYCGGTLWNVFVGLG